jgi:hypothetical protein
MEPRLLPRVRTVCFCKEQHRVGELPTKMAESRESLKDQRSKDAEHPIPLQFDLLSMSEMLDMATIFNEWAAHGNPISLGSSSKDPAEQSFQNYPWKLCGKDLAAACLTRLDGEDGQKKDVQANKLQFSFSQTD